MKVAFYTYWVNFFIYIPKMSRWVQVKYKNFGMASLQGIGEKLVRAEVGKIGSHQIMMILHIMLPNLD